MEILDPFAAAAKSLLPAKTPDIDWPRKARPEQLPPPGEWRTWYVGGGRGGGKTATGSGTLATWITETWDDPGDWCIVAPTFGAAVQVCVLGESGFLAQFDTTPQQVAAGESEWVEYWHRGYATIRMRNGSVIYVDSAKDGGKRIQGKNLKGAWADEIGLWENWEMVWDESLRYAVRVKGAAGWRTRIVATGTPKCMSGTRVLVRRLLQDDSIPKSRLRTIDNRANLDDKFIEEVVNANAGTRLERQELEGELLDDVEGALISYDMIARNRVTPEDVPEFTRVCVGIDPATSTGAKADETGIVVVAKGIDGHGYVLADGSCGLTPEKWATRAIQLYDQYDGDIIVAEKNQGGLMVENVLRTVMPAVHYKGVHSRQGKQLRAEPIAALYEQGRMHHVGEFTQLEDQLTTWVPEDDSPDRMDALVHAATELGLAKWSQSDSFLRMWQRGGMRKAPNGKTLTGHCKKHFFGIADVGTGVRRCVTCGRTPEEIHAPQEVLELQG